MQANPLRAALERGELQIGTWVNLVRNPAVLTLLKSAGLDFARVDMEHTAASMESIANMALLSRALNFPIAVRPPEANREWITRLLDCGVWNLHCPQVENAAHAAEIVAASRYAPRGLRGNAGHSPGTDYDMTGTAAERRAFANRQVFVTVMFETAAAFDDLDAIAAMDGIDALTIGPADLAQELACLARRNRRGCWTKGATSCWRRRKSTARRVRCCVPARSRRSNGRRPARCCWRIPATARCCMAR